MPTKRLLRSHKRGGNQTSKLLQSRKSVPQSVLGLMDSKMKRNSLDFRSFNYSIDLKNKKKPDSPSAIFVSQTGQEKSILNKDTKR